MGTYSTGIRVESLTEPQLHALHEIGDSKQSSG